MKRFTTLFTALAAAMLLLHVTAIGQKTPEKLGWKLGTQTYSFRLFTLEEALRKADSIGLKYVQGFPGQKIGGGIEGTLDYHMTAAKRDSVKSLLRSKGIAMLSYGVVSPQKDEDWRQLFIFLKGMGMKQFATEPAFDKLPMIAQLADEFKIKVAIHDHPRPSIYWHPDTLIKYTAGLSKRLGACADVGHWVRSGLDPIAMLQKLKGRVFELHMKDLHELPSDAFLAYGRMTSDERKARPTGSRPPEGPHDVPWGTGISNIKGILTQLKAQKFKGPIWAEYEYNWANNAPEIQKSIEYVKQVAAQL